VLIADKADSDGDNGGPGVRWDAQQLVADDLRLVRKAQIRDDSGQEETDAVQRHEGPHVDQHADVGLPVLECLVDICHLEVFMFRTTLFIQLEAAQDAVTIGLGEELGLIGEIVDHPEGSDGDNNGKDAFENEYPTPPSVAANTIHLLNRSGKETAKRARESSRREEDCLWNKQESDNHGYTDSSMSEIGPLDSNEKVTHSADGDLIAAVPARDVVVDTGKQAGFRHTEEEARSHQTTPVVDKTHAKHAEAPKHPREEQSQLISHSDFDDFLFGIAKQSILTTIIRVLTW